jgi:DnaJ-class molecular chaperone
MRFLVCLLLVSGCVAASMPPDDGISADLACETARMVLQMRQEIPPTPVSDKCERCQGTGFIGDRAAIKIKCPDCNGTGKKS